jgi:hypothetical protein
MAPDVDRAAAAARRLGIELDFFRTKLLADTRVRGLIGSLAGQLDR